MRIRSGAALLVLLTACGEVSVDAGPSAPADAADGQAADDSAADDSAGDAAADAAPTADTAADSSPADTSPADTGPDAAPADAAPADVAPPPKFTGSAEVEFNEDPAGPPANLAVARITAVQALVPPAGQVYVLWLQRPNGATTFSSVLPAAAEFTHNSLATKPGQPEPLVDHSGALVTMEAAEGVVQLQAPTGPVVWHGGLGPAAWSHVKHVLVQAPGGKGPGFVQTAVRLVPDVVYHAGVAAQVASAGKILEAKVHAEHVFNLIAGESKAVDVDKNGKIDKGLTPHTLGLWGPTTAIDETLYHAEVASEADPQNPHMAIALSEMKECMGKLEPHVQAVVDLAKAGAETGKGLAELDAAAKLLPADVACMATAARHLGTLDLKVK